MVFYIYFKGFLYLVELDGKYFINFYIIIFINIILVKR